MIYVHRRNNFTSVALGGSSYSSQLIWFSWHSRTSLSIIGKLGLLIPFSQFIIVFSVHPISQARWNRLAGLSFPSATLIWTIPSGRKGMVLVPNAFKFYLSNGPCRLFVPRREIVPSQNEDVNSFPDIFLLFFGKMFISGIKTFDIRTNIKKQEKFWKNSFDNCLEYSYY